MNWTDIKIEKVDKGWNVLAPVAGRGGKTAWLRTNLFPYKTKAEAELAARQRGDGVLCSVCGAWKPRKGSWCKNWRRHRQ